METQPGWNSYLKAQQFVKTVLANEILLSNYWADELTSLDYLLHASPQLISRLRDHCHWLTGVRSYDYKSHHQHKSGEIRSKFLKLQALEPNLPFIGEPGVLGDFGFSIDGQLVNLDTLKFHESIIALYRSGLISELKAIPRPVICEIGAGWGGFAAMLLKHVPNAQLVIVDLPHTLIFSATYLPTAFPNLSIGFVGAKDFTGDEDIIFMEPKAFGSTFKQQITLGINMVSFQEMTEIQVRTYSRILSDLGSQYIYSHNRTKSPHNPEMSDVVDCLSEYWIVREEVELLDYDYTLLKPNHISALDTNHKFSKMLKTIIGRIMPNKMYFLLTKMIFGEGKIKSQNNTLLQAIKNKSLKNYHHYVLVRKSNNS